MSIKIANGVSTAAVSKAVYVERLEDEIARLRKAFRINMRRRGATEDQIDTVLNAGTFKGELK